MPQPDQRVGQTLKGRWRIDRLIGVGGMAAVYEARHRNQARVAIKILHPHLGLSGEQRRRFLLEGYAANRVQHAGVVRVLDDDVTDDGCAFLVMDLLSGRTLAEKAAEQGGRLPVKEVVDIGIAVLDVLVAAHGQGVIHRDIKPANLFLTDEDHLVVLDFGIARVADGRITGDHTQAGTLLGTPGFISPEQALGEVEDVGVTSDVWAIGATMFTLVSGKQVHGGRTKNEQIALAMTRPAPPLRSVAPEVPAAVASVVDRALAFEPDDRWPSAMAMQQALQMVRSHWDEILEHPTEVPASVDFGAVDSWRETGGGGHTAAPTAPGDTDSVLSSEPPSVAPMSVPRRRLTKGAWVFGGFLALVLSVLPFATSPPAGREAPDARESPRDPPAPKPAVEGPKEAVSAGLEAPESVLLEPNVPRMNDAPAASDPIPAFAVPQRPKVTARPGSRKSVEAAPAPAPSSVPVAAEPSSSDVAAAETEPEARRPVLDRRH
jgi:serine/threonine protein kinase